jgi:pimeloyl-ACP methyl ester carboxylesterase
MSLECLFKLTMGLGSLLLFFITLYFMQDSLLFFPAPLEHQTQQWIAQHYPQSGLTISNEEGLYLHGWLLQSPPANAKHPVIIYFGGNAEEVSQLAFAFNQFADWSLVLMNYRGYGQSEGHPSEQALFKDALTLYDTLIQRSDIDINHIVVMGRSLGTGVAVHLAAHRRLKGVILISPYDSITSIAQHHYPFLPITTFLQHPFNSIALAPQIQLPMLAIIAGQDTIIPTENSYRLLEKWGGTYQIQRIEQANHNDITTFPSFWQAIRTFLQQMP